jgi:hypothetical protein
MPLKPRFRRSLEEDFLVCADAPLAPRVFASLIDFTAILSLGSLMKSLLASFAGDLAKELAHTWPGDPLVF